MSVDTFLLKKNVARDMCAKGRNPNHSLQPSLHLTHRNQLTVNVLFPQGTIANMYFCITWTKTWPPIFAVHVHNAFVLQPQKRSVLKSPVSTPSSINSTRVKKKKQRVRNPWTDEEVAYLHAAVKSVGKGNWTLALSQFKFQDFRTAVDLKDKWRNLTKWTMT